MVHFARQQRLPRFRVAASSGLAVGHAQGQQPGREDQRAGQELRPQEGCVVARPLRGLVDVDLDGAEHAPFRSTGT